MFGSSEQVLKMLYLLPSLQAVWWFNGIRHCLLACLRILSFALFLPHKVLKGFKNRWMESELGWGSLCVIECQEASWLALASTDCLVYSEERALIKYFSKCITACLCATV